MMLELAMESVFAVVDIYFVSTYYDTKDWDTERKPRSPRSD